MSAPERCAKCLILGHDNEEEYAPCGASRVKQHMHTTETFHYVPGSDCPFVRIDKLESELATTNALIETMTEERDNMYAELRAEVEHKDEALQRIADWANAYPLEVFPEPDFKAAADVLKQYGMSLDAISASNMRHVVKSVSHIVRAALSQTGEGESTAQDKEDTP